MRHANTAIKRISYRLGILVLAAVLAMTLYATPVGAHADDQVEAASTEETAESAAAAEDTTGESAGTVTHGLHATDSETSNANEAEITTTDNGACGLFADAGATIIANALTVQTKGSQAVAVATSASGGTVSIVNSQLATSGTDAPLLSSAGTMEADNVQGISDQSPIASVVEEGSLLIADSILESSYAGSSKDALPTSAIALYRSSEIDTTTSKTGTALFQASGSTLKSAIASGSFFYLTNTQANIVLFDNALDFDASKAKLLTAAGSTVTSGLTTKNAGDVHGAAGKNGATVTFTAIDQELEGDIEVDSISSASVFLLEGSMWTGSSAITANSAGTDLANNIAVNIDASSGWVVTENSTVSTLNIEKGGMLVDERGKAVTIVDADGNKLVDGASDVEVTVSEPFSTTVTTTDANKLKSSTVDRTAFDGEFGTSTAFGTNGSNTTLTDEERAAELKAIVVSWFRNL